MLLGGYPGYTGDIGKMELILDYVAHTQEGRLTFFKEFLQTLPDGEHEITLEYEFPSGVIIGTGTFRIGEEEVAEKPKAPQTGDASNAWLLIGMMGLAAVGMTAIMGGKKKAAKKQ